MLERLRWQLTVWFVGLSVLLYCALSFAALLVFDSGLNAVIDQEMRTLNREVRPAIEYKNHMPSLKSWATNVKNREIQLLATVQLFDTQGKLIEQYGPAGVPELVAGTRSVRLGDEVRQVRCYHGDLIEPGGGLVGYLQAQVSTRARDNSMRQLEWTLIILAPLLLLGLGLCGYVFAGKALRPTEESLGVLRRFVADAGHELNTPITIIQASVETLEKKLTASDATADVLSMIRRASDRMSDLGKNLILLAKIESPGPSGMSRVEKVQLDEMVTNIASELKGAFDSKGIALSCKIVQPVQISAHGESMRTLISNLIENALRYTESGGTVNVSVEERNGQAVLVVEDTGIGIPSESLPRIFERFYRVDKSRSRSVGGSGLGLAIVKAIVDAHKGNMRVESVVDKGSRFTVLLPLRGISSVKSKTNVSSNASH